jgi:hypothetical protein
MTREELHMIEQPQCFREISCAVREQMIRTHFRYDFIMLYVIVEASSRGFSQHRAFAAFSLTTTSPVGTRLPR